MTINARLDVATRCKEGFPEKDNMNCPNMKSRKNDRDWSGDNYDCAVCGARVWLDYEEMR